MTLNERENTIYKSRRLKQAPKQLLRLIQRDCDVAIVCIREHAFRNMTTHYTANDILDNKILNC
jgi:hypothetical protein